MPNGTLVTIVEYWYLVLVLSIVTTVLFWYFIRRTRVRMVTRAVLDRRIQQTYDLIMDTVSSSEDDIWVAESVQGVSIRLTRERWRHILTRRPWLEPFLETIHLVLKNPDCICQSPTSDEYHAIRKMAAFPTDNLIVIYKIISAEDGFVITVFPMSDKKIKRRYRTWPQKYP